MKNTATPVQRLETMLRIWEETLLIAQASHTLSAGYGNPQSKSVLRGSVVYWNDLRKDLLSRKPLNPGKYQTPEEIVSLNFMANPFFCMVPSMLHAWSDTSRRVYNLSANLQRSLEITSTGKIRWKDIHPPFPCFGITLPIPIPWEQAGKKETVDFVLVEFSSTGVKITCLGENLHNRIFFSPEQKRKMIRMIGRKELTKLRAVVHGLKASDEGSHFALPSTLVTTLPTNDQPIMYDVENTEFDCHVVGEAGFQESDKCKLPDYLKLVIRIVAGLCLHLEMVADAKRAKNADISATPWGKPDHEPTLDGSIITDEALVCAADLIEPLTMEEIEYHEKIRSTGVVEAARELPAHFRNSYWRRWPGTGHDPNAPFTVKVKWARVNSRRLPQEGVVVGTKVEVK